MENYGNTNAVCLHGQQRCSHFFFNLKSMSKPSVKTYSLLYATASIFYSNKESQTQ